MEGTLSLSGWIAVAFMGVAGSWMYFTLRPYSGPWYKLACMFLPPVAGGVAIALALCEFYGIEPIYHKMLGAFCCSLLCTPASSAAIALTESNAVDWLKHAALRMLGVESRDTDERPKVDGDV